MTPSPNVQPGPGLPAPAPAGGTDGRAGARRGWRGPRLPILAVFALVALALVGGVLLILATLHAGQRERARAATTAETLTVLRDISRDAVNAETGQRGFFITLDKRYLAPFEAAKTQHGPSIARLKTLVAQSDNERQRELASIIEQLSAAKFAEMDEVVAQIRAGDLFGAQRRILSDEGQDVMERLRRAVTEMEAIERTRLAAASNEAMATEDRLVPQMLGLLVLIAAALGLAFWLVVRNADAEARAAHAAQLAEAHDRANLLAGELNHRVKNLFAVVLAIVHMSGRDTPEAKPALERISDRIRALLKAHGMTQGESGQGQAASLRGLVETVVAPYRSEHSLCTLEGPALSLNERQVVPVGLVLHELVTNAVKYGGWSHPGGEIAVKWQTEPGGNLRIDWQERCVAPVGPGDTKKRGFGSMLLESSGRQLGGTVERTYLPEGIHVSLSFPLNEAAA